MFQPIVTALAKFDNGRLLQKEDAVRSIRGVAGFTISFQGVLGLAVFVLGFSAGK